MEVVSILNSCLNSNTRVMKENSNSARNIKDVNFVPKDVQRIISSHKSIMNRKCSTRRLFLKVFQYSQEDTFLIKMQAFRPSALLKTDFLRRGVFCEHWEILTYSEAVVQRCSVKKVFLEVSQNSQEDTWVLQLYLKRDSGTGVFLWILQNF